MTRKISTVPIALLVTLAACDEFGTQATVARVTVPTTLDLGRGYVGNTKNVGLPLQSEGSSWARIVSTTSDAPQLEAVMPADPALPPGAKHDVVLRWTPEVEGPFEAHVEVVVDVEETERTVVRVSGVARLIPACDDGNPCTDDTFDRDTEACVHAVREGTCSDGSACTSGDRCVEGTCIGEALRCDDDDVCTLDLCDPAVGCSHPPDGRRCDDGDPCTTDVCDRDDGCTHPWAATGTPCGEFSCAIAHVCALGSCRELDVTGSSDGFPCFDGDLCTEDDACLAGVCAGGPRAIGAPQISATLPTFGGPDAWVATDGVTYLFTDADRLVVALPGPTGLRVTAEVPATSDVPPVALEAGRYVTVRDGSLVVWNTSDPARPTIASTHPITGGPTSVVTHLAALPGGAVVGLRPPQVTGGAIQVVDLPDRAGRVVEARVEAGVAVRDLDTSGLRVAWLDDSGRIGWFEADGLAAPQIASTSGLGGAPAAPLRLSLWDDVVAVTTNAGVGLFTLGGTSSSAPVTCRPTDEQAPWICEYVGPGCGVPPTWPSGYYATCVVPSGSCPGTSHCVSLDVPTCVDCDGEADCAQAIPVNRGVCVGPTNATPGGSVRVAAGVYDVALDAGILHVATSDGVHAWTRTGAVLDNVEWQLDPQLATRLERTAGHLLASGTIALPLVVTPTPPGAGEGAQPPPEKLTRVTGPGHGGVEAITDSALPKVAVAGRMSVGEVDLVTPAFASWRLTDRSDAPDRPRLLAGRLRSVPVTRLATNFSGVRLASCDTPEGGVTAVEVVTPSVPQSRAIAACGLVDGLLDVAGDRLFAESGTVPDIRDSEPPRRVRAWNLAPAEGGVDPLLDWDSGTGWGDHAFALRASGDGRRVVRIGADYSSPFGATAPDPGVMLDVFDAAGPQPAWLGRVRLPMATGWQTAEVPAFDGARSLSSAPGAVRLHAVEPAPGESDARQLGELAFPDGEQAPLRVLAMSQGRAWVSRASLDDLGLSLAPILTEVRYAPDDTLSNEGSLVLPAEPRVVFDTGAYAVVATDRAVHLVRPSCH